MSDNNAGIFDDGIDSSPIITPQQQVRELSNFCYGIFQQVTNIKNEQNIFKEEQNNIVFQQSKLEKEHDKLKKEQEIFKQEQEIFRQEQQVLKQKQELFKHECEKINTEQLVVKKQCDELQRVQNLNPVEIDYTTVGSNLLSCCNTIYSQTNNTMRLFYMIWTIVMYKKYVDNFIKKINENQELMFLVNIILKFFKISIIRLISFYGKYVKIFGDFNKFISKIMENISKT